jgi:hypothetical protein
MGRNNWNEGRERAIYRPGQKVEVNNRPGIVDTVIAYDPSTVPPIVLQNDPQPRYPEELKLVSTPRRIFNWIKTSNRDNESHIYTG